MKEQTSQDMATTFETVWAALMESDRQRKENERILNEKFAETDRQMKETDRQMKETDKKIEKAWRQMKANNKEIGGIANSNGEIAESYFINSFKKYPHFAGQDYQFIESNKRYYSKALDLKDEYDLVLYNGVSVAIIEIKYKVRKEDVEETLKKAETFKKLLPQYKDFAIYLGLAGLHVYMNAESDAIKQGVAIIKQVGKNMVVNDGHLKMF
jgi:hypothetical protein